MNAEELEALSNVSLENLIQAATRELRARIISHIQIEATESTPLYKKLYNAAGLMERIHRYPDWKLSIILSKEGD